MTVAWNVLAAFLRGLAVFTNDPVLGDKGVVIQRWLALGALALERGEAGRHELELLCAEIDVMVAQGREPSAEEWASLRARSDAAHEVLQEAAKEAAVEEGPAPEGDSEGGDPS